ncbi:MAG: DUF975 family protein [Desulfobacterota bacterium]|jgi:uncharacterized membrane protein|nr:DUF975 family protein [Thermodesulfobacteriota bacterium]
MLTPNADLMRQAREALKGKWGLAVVGNLIFLVVTGVAQGVGQIIPLVGWAAGLIVGGPLILGLALFFLGLSRGQEVAYSRLFDGFQRFADALVTYLLLALLIFLWSLLLIVPGIMAALSYALTFFLMADRPELKGMEALKESERLMKGNRWKLFCLFLRFIGWFLVGALTMGIGYLWVMPYLQTSAARFYEDVLGNGGAAAAEGTRVKPAAAPPPPSQPTSKPSAPARASQRTEPPKAPGSVPTPAPEPPKPPVNPRARLCLSCHRPITDPEAKACPECGFAVMEVPGFSPKTPPPATPPATAGPSASEMPVKPGSPPAPPKSPGAGSVPPAPPAPLDLEATVRVGKPRLTSTSAAGQPERFDLRAPLTRLGRKSENDLAFPLEKTISGRHCEIYQEGTDWFVKDLGSTNGVLVNGKKVDLSPLQEGDQIKLGNKVFTFTRNA